MVRFVFLIPLLTLNLVAFTQPNTEPVSVQNIPSTNQSVNFWFIAELVNEEQTTTIHSAGAGGSKPHTYDVWVNQKLNAVDSIVIWVDGARELRPRMELSEMGKGNVLIDERTDTIWFYVQNMRTIRYFHYDWHEKRSVSRIYFYPKPHLQLLGYQNKMPYDIDYATYTIQRNFKTVKTNQQWQQIVKKWQDSYPTRIHFINNSYCEFSLRGLSQTNQQQSLQQIAQSQYADFVAIKLTVIDERKRSVLSCYQNEIKLYVKLDYGQFKVIATQYGFEVTNHEQRSDGLQYYSVVYRKSKILELPFLSNYQKLANTVGAIAGELCYSDREDVPLD